MKHTVRGRMLRSHIYNEITFFCGCYLFKHLGLGFYFLRLGVNYYSLIMLTGSS